MSKNLDIKKKIKDGIRAQLINTPISILPHYAMSVLFHGQVMLFRGQL